MTPSQRRALWLRRLALACAALVLAITSLSAFMRLSHAGLGCSDRSPCYGERLRDAQQGRAPAAAESEAVAMARLVHRVAAVLALQVVIVIVVLCLGSAPRLWREGALALALLALALGLAVLGRWTAGARMPAVAIGNLLGGLLMLALSWRLAAPRVEITPSRAHARAMSGSILWARVGLALLLLQLTLGAAVSASYSGLACAGAGDCLRVADGAGWPWHALDPWREPRFDATLPLNPDGALVQLLHRGGALLVSALLLPLAWAAWRGPRRRDGAALLLLLVLQLALGVAMVAAALPLPLALAHNIVAALMLAVLARMA